MGVREEPASQSRREVAFSKIAQIMGLGHYVVPADLLLLDGQEVAAMMFLPVDFKNMNKWKKDPDTKLTSVLQKYLESGVLFKWAVLDLILGNADDHAGNVLMNKKFEIKLIDHGSAFAGLNYSPGKDPKSFIPFYLRMWTDKKFITLTPEERMKYMPILNKQVDESLKFWIDGLPDRAIVQLMNEYGLNPTPVMNRLQELRDYAGKKSEFICKFFSGVLDQEKHQQSLMAGV